MLSLVVVIHALFIIVGCRRVMSFDSIRFVYHQVPSPNTVLRLSSNSDNNSIESSATRQWLEEQFKYNKDDVSKIFTDVSSTGIVNLETDVLIERGDWLKENLALTDARLGEMIRKQPRILKFISKRNLRPKLEYLKERLLWSDVALSKALRSEPSILGCNIEKKIAPTLDWF